MTIAKRTTAQMVAKAFIIRVIFFVDGFFSFMVFFWFDGRVMFYCRGGVCPPSFLMTVYGQIVRLFSSLTFTAMLYMIAKTTSTAVYIQVSPSMTNEPVLPSKSTEVDMLSLQFSPMK